MCLRFYVPKKLSLSELQPNSSEEWVILRNVYQSQPSEFMNVPGTRQLCLPSVIEGVPTDIVETSG